MSLQLNPAFLNALRSDLRGTNETGKDTDMLDSRNEGGLGREFAKLSLGSDDDSVGCASRDKGKGKGKAVATNATGVTSPDRLLDVLESFLTTSGKLHRAWNFLAEVPRFWEQVLSKEEEDKLNTNIEGANNDVAQHIEIFRAKRATLFSGTDTASMSSFADFVKDKRSLCKLMNELDRHTFSRRTDDFRSQMGTRNQVLMAASAIHYINSLKLPLDDLEGDIDGLENHLRDSNYNKETRPTDEQKFLLEELEIAKYNHWLTRHQDAMVDAWGWFANVCSTALETKVPFTLTRGIGTFLSKLNPEIPAIENRKDADDCSERIQHIQVELTTLASSHETVSSRLIEIQNRPLSGGISEADEEAMTEWDDIAESWKIVRQTYWKVGWSSQACKGGWKNTVRQAGRSHCKKFLVLQVSKKRRRKGTKWRSKVN